MWLFVCLKDGRPDSATHPTQKFHLDSALYASLYVQTTLRSKSKMLCLCVDAASIVAEAPATNHFGKAKLAFRMPSELQAGEH